MQGKVFKKAIGQYWVKTDDRTVVCSISNRLRKRLLYPTADPASLSPHVVAVEEIATVDPVAVGDEVVLREANSGTGVIDEVLRRRNKLNRKAASRQPLEQVVVANLDQMVAVVAAARPEPKWRLLDRYLADAEFLRIPALVCVTKRDLIDEREFASEIQVYQDIGYQVILTSAVTGTGIDELRQALKGKVSVLLGKSGVGKTTLLNALQPSLGLAVQEVSDKTGKGRHTTSGLEMFELCFGGFVVDTPGMREFALWEEGKVDIAWLFREMRPYIGSCRFGASCTHSHEPGCTVKDAVAAGRITRSRYSSYLRLRH